jgi:hypothetical protein
MESKYYVVCGTRAEFDRFIRKKMADLYTPTNNLTLSSFVYVDGADRIRGVSNPTGWFYGTWKNHPNIKEIMIQLAGAITDSKRQQIIRDLWKEYRENESN